MNKIKLLLVFIVLVLYNSVLSSQSIDDDTKRLIDETINKFNIIVIEHTLNEYDKYKNIVTQISESKDANKILRKLKNNTDVPLKTKELLNKIENLKQHKNFAFSKNKLDSYLSSKIATIISYIPTKKNNKARKKTIEMIIPELSRIKVASLNKFDDYQIKNVNSHISKKGEMIKKLKDENFIFFIVGLFLILNLIILYILFIIKTKKITTLEKWRRKFNDIDENVLSLETKIKDNGKRLNEIINAYNNLIYNYKELKEQIKSITFKSVEREDYNQKSIYNSHPTQIPQSKITKYAKCPESDGSFKIKYLNDQKANDSLFLLTIDPSNKQRAILSIIENPQYHQQAISANQQFLLPVCEIDRISPQKNHKIVQLSPGELFLNGDKWTLVKKIKIDFQ